jgi:hypothetical protein
MEQLFAMDFVLTTEYQGPPTGRCKEYKPHYTTLADVDVHRLESAPYNRLSELSALNARMDTFVTIGAAVMGIIFAAIAALVAALAVIVVLPSASDATTRNWEFVSSIVLGAVAVMLSIAAILISLLAGRRKAKK